MERHVLVVLPHPDDETFGCGGTIALHARAGTPVTYLCGTKGQMGRNMGRPFFATRESLPDVREAELAEAARILGISDLRHMGLRDKTIEFLDPDELANRIRNVIVEVKPSLIITHHPLYGVHPDHNALGAATIRAVATFPAAERPPIHMMAGGSGLKILGEPDVVVDISPVRDVKYAATLAHRSQSEVMLNNARIQAEKDPESARRWEEMRKRERFWVWKFDDVGQA